MEIGRQIKQLRQRRGITQEALAQQFGMTPQAVSKWECGTAAPDIELLPALSAYFGVTIDELFSLSDDTRMERIQNMIWDVRHLNPADVENARQFLLEKAAREPENGRPHELLADMDRAVVLSDGYYGDPSSVVQVYQETGKPVMMQNVNVIDLKIANS